jgi:hypothetical protein
MALDNIQWYGNNEKDIQWEIRSQAPKYFFVKIYGEGSETRWK